MDTALKRILSDHWRPSTYDSGEVLWMQDKKAIEAKIDQLCRLLITESPENMYCARIILALIRIEVNLPPDYERNHKWKYFKKLWLDKLRSENFKHRDFLETGTISLFHITLKDNLSLLTAEKLQAIIQVVAQIIIPGEKVRAPYDLDPLAKFSSRLFTFPEPATFDLLEYEALRCDIMAGVINCPIDPNNSITTRIIDESSNSMVAKLRKRDVYMNCLQLLSRVYYFEEIIQRSKQDSNGDQRYWRHVIMNNNYFRDEFIDILQRFATMNTLGERLCFMPGFNIIKEVVLEIKCFMRKIVLLLPRYILDKILRQMSDRAMDDGFYWAFAKRHLESVIKSVKTDLDVAQALRNLQTDNTRPSNIPVTLDDILTERGLHYEQAALRWSMAGNALAISFRVAIKNIMMAHESDIRVIGRMFLDQAIMCRSDYNPNFLLEACRRTPFIIINDRNLTEVSWAQVASNAAIADYLAEFVSSNGRKLYIEHWHMIAMILKSLTTSIKFTTHDWGCARVAIMIRATLKLFSCVQNYAFNTEFEDGEPHSIIFAHFYQTVWVRRMERTIVDSIVNICFPILDFESTYIYTGHMVTLRALIEVVPHLNFDAAPILQLATFDKIIYNTINALHKFRHPSIKLLSFTWLRAVTKVCILADSVSLLRSRSHQRLLNGYRRPLDGVEIVPNVSFAAFERAIIPLQNITSRTLYSVRKCVETFEVVPNSSKHSAILGYLMLSIALFEQCNSATASLLQYYTQQLRRTNFTSFLMETCIHLLPRDMLTYALYGRNFMAKPMNYEAYIINTITIAVEDVALSSMIGPLACRCLFGALMGLDTAQALNWLNNLPEDQGAVYRRLLQEFYYQPIRLTMAPSVSSDVFASISRLNRQ